MFRLHILGTPYHHLIIAANSPGISFPHRKKIFRKWLLFKRTRTLTDFMSLIRSFIASTRSYLANKDQFFQVLEARSTYISQRVFIKSLNAIKRARLCFKEISVGGIWNLRRIGVCISTVCFWRRNVPVIIGRQTVSVSIVAPRVNGVKLNWCLQSV